jgi:cobaltochelatase CobS
MENITESSLELVTVFIHGAEFNVPKSDCQLDPIAQIWGLKPENLQSDDWINTWLKPVSDPVLEDPFKEESATVPVPVVRQAHEYELMTVKELKTEAMAKCDAMAVKKSWIQTTSKAELIAFLLTGQTPIPFRSESPVNVTPVSTGRLGDGQSDLGQMLAAAIAPFLGNLTSKVDESDVIRIVEERLEDFRRPNLVVVKDLKGRVSPSTLQHKQFGKLLNYCSQRKNVYLVGPAASGKTHVAKAVSKVLDLPFYAISVCAQTPVSAFFGYMDAMGNYVPTNFYRAYKDGGIFLLDEFDNGNPNTGAAVNQATANDECGFPCGMVQRHPDFIVICAGNTYGTGADRQYVGRNQLDAATLDRFAFINWSYDEDLELAIGCNANWTKHVQRIRKAVADLKIRHVVSMRASENGGIMLAAGESWIDVEQEYIWKGLDRNEVAKIVAHMAAN